MTEEVKFLIKKIITETVKECGFSLEDIILFGSRARGDFDEESDWDILVILDENLDPMKKKHIWYLIYKKLHKKFPLFSFDIVLKSKVTYEQEKEIVNTLSSEINREGIRL